MKKLIIGLLLLTSIPSFAADLNLNKTSITGDKVIVNPDGSTSFINPKFKKGQMESYIKYSGKHEADLCRKIGLSNHFNLNVQDSSYVYIAEDSVKSGSFVYVKEDYEHDQSELGIYTSPGYIRQTTMVYSKLTCYEQNKRTRKAATSVSSVTEHIDGSYTFKKPIALIGSRKVYVIGNYENLCFKLGFNSYLEGSVKEKKAPWKSIATRDLSLVSASKFEWKGFNLFGGNYSSKYKVVEEITCFDPSSRDSERF